MNTIKIGNISEISVAKRYMELGFTVSFPFGGSERYDLVIEKAGEFKRIQVKTGHLNNGAITSCIKSPTKGTSYKGDIDIFAIYCPETSLIYVIDIDKVGETSSITFRTSVGSNRKNIKYAKDYKL